MNRMFISPFALALSLVAASALLTGCSGTTDRGVRYTLTPSRELEAFIAGDVATVHEAARRVVVEQYRYRITQHNVDAREGIVTALTAHGENVRVETTYSSPRVTRVNVFVGPLGDESVMRELLSAIEDRARILAQRNEAVTKAQATKPQADKPQPKDTAPKPAATAPAATKPATTPAAPPATAKPTTTTPPATTKPAAPATTPSTTTPAPARPAAPATGAPAAAPAPAQTR